MPKDWVGYKIDVPNNGGHASKITGKHQPDKRDNMWWWKCMDCTSSSGSISTAELERLYSLGYVKSAEDGDKDLQGVTGHPVNGGAGKSEMYDMYAGYGWGD